MNSETMIAILVCIIILFFTLSITSIILILKSLPKSKEKIKKSDNQNIAISSRVFSADLQRIYSTIDTKAVNEEIDNWIGSYLSDYIAKNVTIQGADYIKKADIDKMLKEVLTAIITNMSDLYRWYISLMINIDNEDRVIDFINNKLSLQIIAFVSKFNQPTDTKQ